MSIQVSQKEFRAIQVALNHSLASLSSSNQNFVPILELAERFDSPKEISPDSPNFENSEIAFLCR